MPSSGKSLQIACPKAPFLPPIFDRRENRIPASPLAALRTPVTALIKNPFWAVAVVDVNAEVIDVPQDPPLTSPRRAPRPAPSIRPPAAGASPTCPQGAPPSVRPARRAPKAPRPLCAPPDVPPRPALCGPACPLGPRPTCPPKRPRPPWARPPSVRPPALCAPARRWGPHPTCPQGAPPSMAPPSVRPPAAGDLADVAQDPRPLCAPPAAGGLTRRAPKAPRLLCGDWARPRACPGVAPHAAGGQKNWRYLQRPSYEATHALRVSHPGLSIGRAPKAVHVHSRPLW